MNPPVLNDFSSDGKNKFERERRERWTLDTNQLVLSPETDFNTFTSANSHQELFSRSFSRKTRFQIPARQLRQWFMFWERMLSSLSRGIIAQWGPQDDLQSEDLH